MLNQFDVSDIDSQIEFHKQKILESKLIVARLSAAKTTQVKNYEFLRNHKEANEMLALMTQFPQIKSARELQILFCIKRHKSCKEIADELFISEKTVKCHKTSVYRKLGVRNEKELVARYFSIVQSNNEQLSAGNSQPLY